MPPRDCGIAGANQKIGEETGGGSASRQERQRTKVTASILAVLLVNLSVRLGFNLPFGLPRHKSSGESIFQRRLVGLRVLRQLGVLGDQFFPIPHKRPFDCLVHAEMGVKISLDFAIWNFPSGLCRTGRSSSVLNAMIGVNSRNLLRRVVVSLTQRNSLTMTISPFSPRV